MVSGGGVVGVGVVYLYGCILFLLFSVGAWFGREQKNLLKIMGREKEGDLVPSRRYYSAHFALLKVLTERSIEILVCCSLEQPFAETNQHFLVL